jgi:hypothetical protein
MRGCTATWQLCVIERAFSARCSISSANRRRHATYLPVRSRASSSAVGQPSAGRPNLICVSRMARSASAWCARKNGAQVRLYSRPGNHLTHRFPLIVETLARLRSRSCIFRWRSRRLRMRVLRFVNSAALGYGMRRDGDRTCIRRLLRLVEFRSVGPINP